LSFTDRVPAPVLAAEVEAAVPDRCPSQRSPIHPGTSASPAAAVAAVEEAVVAAVAAPAGRSCRSGSP